MRVLSACKRVCSCFRGAVMARGYAKGVCNHDDIAKDVLELHVFCFVLSVLLFLYLSHSILNSPSILLSDRNFLKDLLFSCV